MLESIFGSEKDEELEKLRAELENKEQKIKKFERELEKERKRAKNAITEKQETDKKLKDTKHKIETLKDKIEKLEKDKKEEKISKKVKFLKRNELISFIQQFNTLNSQTKSLVTYYIENREDISNDEYANLLQGIESETGIIYLKDRFGVINCALIPPIPIESEFNREEKFQLEKLRDNLESNFRIGFISAHAGRSVVGVLEETEFSNFEIIDSPVKGSHSKGGFSQGRFERGRDKQIEKHMEEISEEAEGTFEEIDYLILDGNRTMVSDLRDEISLDVPLLEKSLDIGKVEDSKKEEYVKKIWGARLYIF